MLRLKLLFSKAGSAVIYHALMKWEKFGYPISFRIQFRSLSKNAGVITVAIELTSLIDSFKSQ